MTSALVGRSCLRATAGKGLVLATTAVLALAGVTGCGGSPRAGTLRSPASTTTSSGAEPASSTVTTSIPVSPTTGRQPQATAPPAAAGCPSTLASQLRATSGATQVITVVATGYGTTDATLAAWALSGGCWRPALGPFPARLGAAGLRDHRVEGDGSTPTGAFGIGPVMYGNGPNPGARYPYHPLQCGDWWDEDPASPQYNAFVHVTCGSQPPFAAKSEALWTVPVAYRSFAVIGFNTNPVVPGLGSGIFLADGTGQPTVGCVSLAQAGHDAVLAWLDPAAHPLVVIGTSAEIDNF